MDKKKSSVVEDNSVYCKFVWLAREGLRTAQASNLSTVRKLLVQAIENYIIVSYFLLTEGDGIDLLHWMRKDGKMQSFFIMTEYVEVHTAAESMKLGALDYIPKQLLRTNSFLCSVTY